MPKFGETLLKEKVITKEELNLCLQVQRFVPRERIGTILKDYNFIDDLKIAEFVAQEIGWTLFTKEYVPDHAVINEIGLDFFNKNHIYPVKNGVNTLFVVSYIDNVDTTDYLRARLQLNQEEKDLFAIGNELDVRNALDRLVLEETRKTLNPETFEIRGDDEGKLTAWLDSLVRNAIISRSTDIHIEPTWKTAEVRFRVDGLLKFICCVKKRYVNAIANIILNRCHANPGEYNFQEGGFSFKLQDSTREYDIRFSQVPSVFGPSIVLRLHDKVRSSIPLVRLGLTQRNCKIIDQALRKPHGIILVTGPTGCGKSTSLYGMLNEIKTIGRKILTVEDPVEINHSLMTQVQINQAQQVTFARTIRAFLRHDPDVILVGEIRDSETAQEAVRASITGHQVFSTLHTNGPIEAILRLKDLGVAPSHIASSLLAVVSQRLVRKLCSHCKAESPVSRDSVDECEAKYMSQDIQILSSPRGCGQCLDGYMGRTVIAEVMLVDDLIRELIASDRLSELPKALRDRGHQSIADNARDLVSMGTISLQEAVRVLG